MLLEYKTHGETMEQFIKRIKEKLHVEKLAYTARLDPMAKGWIPILVNDECLKIKKHLNSKKTYQVKIICGFQTDSDDPLGLITKHIKINNSIYIDIFKNIIDYLDLINHTSFLQKYHYFSTKMLNHRKKQNIVVNDSHIVELFNYNLIKQDIYNYQIWKNKIIKKINSIDNTKNFRQEEIIKQWNDIILDNIYYLKINLSVSSGFFVRQFVRDMSEIIDFPLMCYNINRKTID